jgi:hypothetical protein
MSPPSITTSMRASQPISGATPSRIDEKTSPVESDCDETDIECPVARHKRMLESHTGSQIHKSVESALESLDQGQGRSLFPGI